MRRADLITCVLFLLAAAALGLLAAEGLVRFVLEPLIN